MSRRPETRGLKGGFIPSDASEPNKKTDTTQWQGSSDREESLSDPRWHKRPTTKGKKANNNSHKQPNAENTTKIQDARELIAKKKVEETPKKPNFPKIFFTNTQTEQTNLTEENKVWDQLQTKCCQTESTATPSSSTSCQTDIKVTSNFTQTQSSGEQKSEDEIWDRPPGSHQKRLKKKWATTRYHQQ